MEDLWKEIWPAVLVIAIGVFTSIRNASKASPSEKEEQEVQPDTLGENFPHVEILETPVSRKAETVKPRRLFDNKHKNSVNVPEKSIEKTVDTPAVPAAERGAKVALKGKSDVKKAFIYSEIFNRKYK